MSKKYNGLKVLIIDIETAPILGFVWGLWENNVALNQINSDWHVLSWSAKWLEAPDGTVYGPHNKVMYQDQRKIKNVEDDSKLLEGIWNLINDADILVTQNGRAFDAKKLNARFILNGMKPPSSYKHIDTKIIASSKFAFTSNKLEYMTDKLCKKYKKLKHTKFAGFEMWKECLSGNIKAWKEMERYNKYDVLSLEELYWKLQPWDNSLNVNLYTQGINTRCACGSVDFKKNGYTFTAAGKYQRYACKKCGAESKDRVNLFDKDKKKSIRVKV